MALLSRSLRWAIVLLLAGVALSGQAPGLRDRLASALEAVPAVDNHTHLLEAEPHEPAQDREVPLLMRSTHPAVAKALRERFGVIWDPARAAELHEAGVAARRSLLQRLGGADAYWADHLRWARTEIALVNQLGPEGTNATTLRWVPTASPLLLPLPPLSLQARSPLSHEELGTFHAALLDYLRTDGLPGPPPTLEAYLRFLDRQLRVWQRQGAVALKFVEAYHRTLRFEEVGQERADALWRRGKARPLGRAEYLALQDFLARHLFREAGKLHLPVHLHTGLGGSPRLRLQEADPRNMEGILTDPAFAGTDFVLIHAGAPDPRPAAWMAAFKMNVWLDLSGLAFYLPPDELAAAVRACLLHAPERSLFSTDAFGCYQIPVGPEVTHAAFGEVLRGALCEALASLVELEVLDEVGALRIGRGVLQENARRLYKWETAPPQRP